MFAQEQKQVLTGAVHNGDEHPRVSCVGETGPAAAVLVKLSLCSAVHASADCCASQGPSDLRLCARDPGSSRCIQFPTFFPLSPPPSF